MKITLKQVYNFLSDKIVDLYINDNIESNLKDIKLITKKQNHFLKDILYVGKTSALRDNIRDLKEANLMLINDNNLFISQFFNSKLNIIEINSNEDIFELFNQTQDFFSQKFEVINSSATLLDSIIKGKGLNNVAEAASEILSNPVIVIDSSYKILAYSDPSQITDPYWKDNIERSYCSYDFIAAVKRMKSVQYGLKNDYPFEVTCDGSSIIKLIYKIEINQKYVGNVVALASNRPFKERDKELLVLISKVIAEEMKKDSTYRNMKDVMYENILLDLLEEKIRDTEEIKERILSAGIKLGNKFSVFALDISKYNSKGRYSGYLTDSIQNLFPVMGSVYYNGNIVMLHSTKKEYSVEILLNDGVKEFLNKTNIFLGVSKEFTDIIECRKYYKQAIKALEINKILSLKDNISLYGQLQFYHLISLAIDKTNETDFSNPTLLKLRKYDSKNNTDFYNTLYIFLENNLNLQASAKELFIHRNTMRYRINKIKALTRIDFRNREGVFNLYASYKIMNYIDKVNVKKALPNMEG